MMLVSIYWFILKSNVTAYVDCGCIKCGLDTTVNYLSDDDKIMHFTGIETKIVCDLVRFNVSEARNASRKLS